MGMSLFARYIIDHVTSPVKVFLIKKWLPQMKAFCGSLLFKRDSVSPYSPNFPKVKVRAGFSSSASAVSITKLRIW